MIRFSAVATLAAVALASFVAAGCGESPKDAKQVLCADLSTLKSNINTLAQMNGDTSVGEFRQARKNVKESWVDVKNSAENLGNVRMQKVDDAWDDVENLIDDVDDAKSLSEAQAKLNASLDAYDQARKDVGAKIDCSNSNA